MRIVLKLLDRLPGSWIRAGSALRGRFPVVKWATDWLPNLLRNREGRIQKGLGRGLRFNAGPSAVGFVLGTHDTDVQYAMSRLVRPGMTCYDLGANVGFTAVIAARCVGPTGRVVCFEPLPGNADLIRENARLNGFGHVAVRQLALAGENGEAEFRTSHAPTWGRLAAAGATPAESGVTRVPVRTLDALAAAGDLPDPQFIKMDVEGAEAGVLAGAREMLTRAKPVMVIELHHTHAEVAAALDGLGYELHPLAPGGTVADPNGEYQLLAYPAGHADGAALWAAVAAGERLVPA